MTPTARFFDLCRDLADLHIHVLPSHRVGRTDIHVSVPSRGYSVAQALLTDGPAANEPPRYLVFSASRARRAGLLDFDALARRLSYDQLRQLAEGVVVDMAAAREQASELGGAFVRTPHGQLLWVDADRDRRLDDMLVRAERRWADERVARRGEVWPWR